MQYLHERHHLHRKIKMKILFVNIAMHAKNMHAFMHYGNNITTTKISNLDNFNLADFDIVYSPGMPLHVSKYPNTKFIFGPHFSVFPDPKRVNQIRGNNVIYVQPSDWARDAWRCNHFCQGIRIETLPFGVDTHRFNEVLPIDQRTQVFIYFKHRHPMELKLMQQFLNNNHTNHKLFSYDEKYDENDYLKFLHLSKFGIWVGAHESQGFALEEALSCNVPLLVWNVTSMNQEHGQTYPNIKATTIPYWDDTCGEQFTNISQLSETFSKFMHKLNENAYAPRKYVLENVSINKCKEKWEDLVKSM
jgi:glycosyltransferase involved in cell wall biosynthesis